MHACCKHTQCLYILQFTITQIPSCHPPPSTPTALCSHHHPALRQDPADSSTLCAATQGRFDPPDSLQSTAAAWHLSEDEKSCHHSAKALAGKGGTAAGNGNARKSRPNCTASLPWLGEAEALPGPASQCHGPAESHKSLAGGAKGQEGVLGHQTRSRHHPACVQDQAMPHIIQGTAKGDHSHTGSGVLGVACVTGFIFPFFILIAFLPLLFFMCVNSS